MIFRLFQTNRLFGYILSYVVTLVFMVFAFPGFELVEGSLLYHLIGNSLIAQTVTFLFIVLLLPYSMISFFEKHQLHKKSVYFQYFLFLLLTFPVFLKGDIQDMVLLPLLISILNLLMSSYNKTKANIEIAQIGLLFGILVLLKLESFFLLPFMIIGMAVFRSFVIKDILQLVLCAVSVPLLLYGFDMNGHLGIAERMIGGFGEILSFSTSNFGHYVPLIPASVFSLIAFFNLISRVNYLAIRQQLNRYVFIWLALFSTLLLFVESAGDLGVYFFALAAIVPLNYYFKTIKSRFWSDVQIVLIAGVAAWLM